ncbi:MAG: beta-N-acetylglucosaminidase domain-containing protein [Muribaculaceae bacterium]
MKKASLIVALTAIGALLTSNVKAQESDFDLSSQRSEKQDVMEVPGKKINHNGLIINPTPHQMNINSQATLNVANGFNFKLPKNTLTRQIAESGLKSDANGVKTTIAFGKKASAKKGVKQVTGAYQLTITSKGIDICAYDERGAFYGLQTLRQIAQSPVANDGNLPLITINDYPDLPDRGVVEGFYGTPWSHQVRLSLIDFYGKFKMCTYLYGPKDDPYHSCPNWRLPYPEKEAAQIKDLVDACNRNYVDFVWAIHPGQDIKWNEDDYNNLVNKFNLMYDLGVRSFAIFFDDISGEGTNPVKQVELLNRLNKEFVLAKGDVAPLTVCPTDYSRLWANPTPQGSLAIYGNTLHPSIKVFWTGDVVCSDLTKETMEWLNTRIKRPGYYWWNFPVTDYARHIIMQGPTYGLDTSLTANDLCGLVSNPMEHGEASKLALYGVADYCWNIADYNPLDNWERGLAELTPEALDAYRTFAIHSCDTETGYRRSESWETETFSIDNFTEEQYQNLMNEFKKVESAEATMKQNCTNSLLMNELSPWLSEFTKLGQRGIKALQLLKLYKNGNYPQFWQGYVDNLMTAEARKAYEQHKSGTMKLQPFYETTMDDLSDHFFQAAAKTPASTPKGIGSFPTLRTTQSKLMLDSDTTTYYHSGKGMSKEGGDWVGVDLGQVIPVWQVNILQGRNSVDDVDYFDHATLECSADGKTWHTLIAEMTKQYVINWEGEAVNARYVRLRKLPSQKANWLSVRSFVVNPISANRLGFKISAEQPEAALRAFDRLPATAYNLNGTMTFELPNNNIANCVMLTRPQNGNTVTVTQINGNGQAIINEQFATPYISFKVDKNTKCIKIDGETEIFEVIMQQ